MPKDPLCHSEATLNKGNKILSSPTPPTTLAPSVIPTAAVITAALAAAAPVYPIVAAEIQHVNCRCDCCLSRQFHLFLAVFTLFTLYIIILVVAESNYPR